MYIEALRIRNFRRLRDVRINLASDISIFVGANNSGKTSAAHAIQLFTSTSRVRFSIHDFSAGSWTMIDAFGEGQQDAVLPTISLDIWFNVGPMDLHRIVNLLPSLSWQGHLVGIRIEFAAIDPEALLANFGEARGRARANIRPAADGVPDFRPSPRTLREYLTDNRGVPPKLIIFNGFLVGARAQHCQGQIRQRDRFATTVTIPTRNGDFGATRAGSEWPARRAHSSACPNA